MEDVKVFVSSTYVDLQDHRRRVDEVISRMCSQFVGMEHLGSRPSEPKQACYTEIDRCQLFIGIYAHRYGFVPPGETLSITELEFDHARSRGLQCYCYVVDSNHPWPPKHIDYKSAEKRDALLKKVNELVRSTFTTPDNLAKQVAADLNLALHERCGPPRHDDLIGLLQEYSRHEIATSIGPKYVRELYVSRALDSSIVKRLRSLKSISRHVASLETVCADFKDSLDALIGYGAPIPQTSAAKVIAGNVAGALTALSGGRTDAATTAWLSYPTSPLLEATNRLKSAITRCRRDDIVRFAARNNLDGLEDSTLEVIESKLEDLETRLKPVYLVIDRAGGGKTNLLCSLTDTLAADHPCIFVAGKSIHPASENAILKYLRSAYPISEDPIGCAAEYAASQNTYAIVVLDGINENLDPQKFNLAIHSLVRSYYGKPVRFVVSCRDIYWSYFKGEFWDSHCAMMSRDKLYSFTPRELSKAVKSYFRAFYVRAELVGNARQQLQHPLLLRFYCEAFRGKPDCPTVVGKVDDIRLLELFDTYCSRKFDQIRSRLGLSSSQEIIDCIGMIGLEMLRCKKRLLPVRVVIGLTSDRYGQASSRSPDSWYVQILDEDILLEEKPEGPTMNIKVGFVYDEFMEYVIARALWADKIDEHKARLFPSVSSEAGRILAAKEKFISSAGIVIYLGELLSMASRDEGLEFVDWLIQQKRLDLACRLIVRWPKATMSDKVFGKLLSFHKRGDNAHRLEAWKAMEQICLRHWELFFRHITAIPLTGQFRPCIVFPFLGRVGGGPTVEARLETMKWIRDTIRKREYMISDPESPDFKNGIRAIERIMESGGSGWKSEQSSQAKQILAAARKIGREFTF